MKIQCKKCSTIYNFDDTKIPDHDVRIECKKCGNVIIVPGALSLTTCPKCGHKQNKSDECSRCGAIFNKVETYNNGKFSDAISSFHGMKFIEAKESLMNISTNNQGLNEQIKETLRQIVKEYNNLSTLANAQLALKDSLFYRSPQALETFCDELKKINTKSKDFEELINDLLWKAGFLQNKIEHSKYEEFCPKCRKKLIYNEKFCFHCGHEHDQPSNNELTNYTFPKFQINFTSEIGIDVWGKTRSVSGTYNEEENSVKELNQGEMTITIGREGIVVTAGTLGSIGSLRIYFTQLVDIQYLNRHLFVQQTSQNKSVVGRAIVGGLLLGGLGAVVGAASGVSQTDTTKSDYLLMKFWDRSSRDLKYILMCGNNKKEEYIQFAADINEQIIKYIEESITLKDKVQQLLENKQSGKYLPDNNRAIHRLS